MRPLAQHPRTLHPAPSLTPTTTFFLRLLLYVAALSSRSRRRLLVGVLWRENHNRMSTRARKRVLKDKKKLLAEPIPGISAEPLSGHNIMVWQAVIFGPDDTPWEGGTFELRMTFSETYPADPPTVVFVSQMFHPNIYRDGKICLDLLQDKWSPAYGAKELLLSIQTLLNDPNPDSPAHIIASKMYEEDREQYIREVRKCVEASWVYRE